MKRNPSEFIEDDKRYVWHHLTQHSPFQKGAEPQIFVKAKGCTVTNIQGKEFIDGVAGGVWCVNVGFGRESIARAVYDQLAEMPYYAHTVGNLPSIELSRKLSGLMPGPNRRSFYSSSGSEANEKAFKMARLRARLKSGKDKYKILYRHRDYHGTTFGALAATGQEERRAGFGPLPEGFEQVPECFCYRCPFGKTYPGCDIDCAKALERAILKAGPDSVAAFIAEAFTSGGGILVPVREYFPMVREICDKYDVILIMDEVVNGFGRTGKWFGYQHFDFQPDIVTLGKGIASSYMPLSATVATEDMFETFLADPSDKMHYFRDISTYAGCAGGFAAAVENVRIMEEENLVERSRVMGEYLLGRLRELGELPGVGDVRGQGLFAGLEFVRDKKSRQPADDAFVGKILAHAAGNGVLLGRMNRSVPGMNCILTVAPAFVITKEEIDRIVTVLRQAILAVS